MLAGLIALAVAVLALMVCPATGRAAPDDGTPNASIQVASTPPGPRWRVAPEREESVRLLLEVTLNGMAAGVLLVLVKDGQVILPPQTARKLRLRAPGDGSLDPASLPGSRIRLDRHAGTLELDIPASAMTDLEILAGGASPVAPLSPEIWGGFANYDINLRQRLEGSGPEQGTGGLVTLHSFGPDFSASSGWSYDSDRPPSIGSGPVRLDSQATWRPAAQDIATNLGDIISSGGLVARAYRFGGLSVGTDHSGQPGWTAVPVPTVSGTAQAAGAIDVWINGQRSAHEPTAGGPFSVALPPGSYLPDTRVVVTDVTGRVVDLPFEVPQVNMNLLRQGTVLWSAGIGLPRFDWGSASDHYLTSPVAEASLRYGVTGRVTTRLHAEAADGLLQGEGSVSSLLTPRIGVTATAAASQTHGGAGGFADIGLTVAGPWKLTADTSAGSCIGVCNDVVSWSGRIYDRAHGIDPALSLPASSLLTGRLSWQPQPWFGISAAYQRNTYPDTTKVGLISVTATAQVSPRIGVYGSLLNIQGAQGATTLLVGLSMPLGGEVYGSVSASRQGSSTTGGVSASRTLGLSPGDAGGYLNANRTGAIGYASGEADVRTGYGIPGAGFSWLGGNAQGYARLQGAVGIADGHTFAGDPVQSALLVADIGRPGVEVLLNGVESARSGADGKAIIPVAVAGTPQRVEIDDRDLPITAIAARTREVVALRDGGGGVARFDLTTGEQGATVRLLLHGRPLPPGTVLQAPGRDIPVGPKGTAWVPVLARDAVLTALLPDGRRCLAATGFDGNGGPGRMIGPFDCQEVR